MGPADRILNRFNSRAEHFVEGDLTGGHEVPSKEEINNSSETLAAVRLCGGEAQPHRWLLPSGATGEIQLRRSRAGSGGDLQRHGGRVLARGLRRR